MSPLTIYRASAGAGKTFRLVVEYIKLLMLRPDEYRHILAVTFTKKATQEMKMRILSQLYGLREGLSSSKDYMDKITEETGIPEQEVMRNAGKALELILNDYGHFRIETIDSFFQSVLRNMTRELDISSNMRVELNGEQVKDKAIDEMIDNLEPTDHVFRRIVAFADTNMQEGKTWNVVSGLKSFGKNIFTDFYQSHAAEYKELLHNDKNLFKNYGESLWKIKKQAEKDIVEAAERLRQTFEKQGIDIAIFKNSAKSGLAKMYEKISNGDLLTIPATVLKYAESDDEWLKAADKKKYGTQIISEILRPALCRYLDNHRRLSRLIITSDVLLRHLNNIELLEAIETAVDKSNVKANRFLLSSTNQLLADMIGESDSTFIYEKIGTHISHLMIDEFQDTSTLQWKNFKHLLLECMSHYDAETARGTVGNMIVGDVKQSIYRWRSGDWRLLDNISQEFPNPSDTHIEPLKTNYRSKANIINFNNAFFEEAKDLFGVGKAYDDVRQETKPGSKAEGEIMFYMLSKDAYKCRHKMICGKVASLIDRGVKPKDIAIISRNNNILKELAKAFMDNHPNIKVVSMESFQISSSVAVNSIVCALRLLHNPNDRIQLAILEKNTGIAAEECQQKLASIAKNRSLLDIVEEIFRTFGIEKHTDDSSYISAFFDYIKDFTCKNTPTIRNFIKYWDETISAKTIETEATNGVQLMTIHKSKGLEFDNVIIADGAWDTNVARNNIWVEMAEEPFSDIPFSLIQASQKLKDSIFTKDYEEECLQNSVDNLNLLYVAFTRAAKNLYFFGQTSRKLAEAQNGQTAAKYLTSSISGNVEMCIDALKTEAEYRFYPTLPYEEPDTDDTLYYYTKRFGDFAQPEEKAEKKGQNVFDMPVTTRNITLNINKPDIHFIQSNRSKQFINQENSGQENNEDSSILREDEGELYLSLGLLLHNVLSQITTLDDVDRVLQQLESEGIINEKRLSNLIRKRITDSRHAKEWFAPGWTVFNECAILTQEGTKRPDRVITNGKETIVIDFKFGTQKPEYREQVLTYQTLLQQMSFPNVRAFLWYVYNDRVEQVK